MDNLSVADALALKNSGDGMFGGTGSGGLLVLVILFLFFFSGNFGRNNNDMGNDAVRQEILSNQHFNALANQISNVNNGLCSTTYELSRAIAIEGRQMERELANCCCNTQLAISQVVAQNDRNTCSIIDAIHKEGEASRMLMHQQQMDYVRDQLSLERNRNSQYEQSRYILGQLGEWRSNPPCYNSCGYPYPFVYANGCTQPLANI